MIKTIIFDLDGVLCSTKNIHFEAFNEALIKNGERPLSIEEHLTEYDGLSTVKKLDKLTGERKLSGQKINNIFKDKQSATNLLLSSLDKDNRLYEVLSRLKKDYTLVCCSNCIHSTLMNIIYKLGLQEMFKFVMSNEDVSKPKPHPEIYMRAMIELGVSPAETIIIEDSEVGRRAAKESGAHVMCVNSPEDVTYDSITFFLSSINKKPMKWVDKNLNVVIPMAGAGSRFIEAGYTFPKPLIDVNGEPMIKVVVDSLNIDANYIYIVQEEHYNKYNLESVLNLITPNCKIVKINGITEGAACSVMKAREFIDNDKPLLLANSDQYIEWNPGEFLYSSQHVDGSILVFENCHPKWSYAKLNEKGFVERVAEKNPISNLATVGVYWWRHGNKFCKSVDDMIAANDRTNNEFYVCPSYNYLIKRGAIVKVHKIDKDKMWGLGEPEQLNTYLKEFHK